MADLENILAIAYDTKGLGQLKATLVETNDGNEIRVTFRTYWWDKPPFEPENWQKGVSSLRETLSGKRGPFQAYYPNSGEGPEYIEKTRHSKKFSRLWWYWKKKVLFLGSDFEAAQADLASLSEWLKDEDGARMAHFEPWIMEFLDRILDHWGYPVAAIPQ